MDSKPKQLFEFDYMDYILAGFRMFANAFQRFYIPICDLAVFMFVFTFLGLVDDFLTGIEQNKMSFLGKYAGLKNVMCTLNKTAGLIMLGMLCDMLTYYATNILEVTGTSNWLRKAQYVFYMFSAVAVFVIPSSSTSEVNKHVAYLG